MAGLNTQVIPINLGFGLDTKTDQKQVVPGKLTTLENAVFTKSIRLDKKAGDLKYPNMTLDGDELTSGDSLATFNEELLQYQNQNLYSRSVGTDLWIDKGPTVSAIVNTKQIVKNTAAQTQADSAVNNGVSVFAWEDSRGGVRASVVDEGAGTALVIDQLIDIAGSRVRCVAFSSYLYVFYYKSGSLYGCRINPLNPSVFGTPIAVTSTINTTNPTYDVYPYLNLRMAFSYNVQGSTATRFAWLDDALAVQGGGLAPKTITEASTNCLGIIPGPSTTFFVVYQNGSDGVRCTVRNNGGGEVRAPFTIENITMDDVVNVTGYTVSSTTVRIFYEVEASETYNQVVRVNTATVSGVAGIAADFMRSVGLYTKAFMFTDSSGADNFYVGLVYDSLLQATYFTARSDGLLVAKQQPNLSGGLTTRPILANVWSDEDGVYSWALINKTQLISENATLFTPTGVAQTSLDFNSDDVFTAAQLGQNLHIVGGFLSMYDGQSVVEHGFHLFPENIECAGQTSGGNLDDGSYLVCVTYEWTDNYGQLHRSAPSVPLQVAISGGGGNGLIEVTVPTLRLTAKKNNRTNISIVGYVTEADGSIFYRWTPITSPTYNDLTADDVDLPDIEDVVLSNEILYTVGGVLENIPASACSVISVFKQRLFLGGMEQANTFWYSKEIAPNVPVEFSDLFVKNLEPEGGRQTSFGVLDDKLLLLKRDRYFFTFGDGPNNTGADGDFAEPQFVTADAGCLSAVSMVRVPMGLMFKSAKGLYMVDSTLNPTYIGAEVEAYNANTITSGVLVTDLNQIRFTTLEGPTLVYDYYQKQWGTFSGIAARDALMWQSQYIFLRTNGNVYYDVPGYYKDAGGPIRMKIGTGWISFATVAGFQRIYSLFILGEYKSSHILKVSIGYNYSEAYSQIAYIRPDDVLDVKTYGEDSPYGEEGTLYGGRNSAYRFNINMKTQKCESIRFLIEEITTAATPGDQSAFNITAIAMEAGLKVGTAKLRASQNIAASN